MSRHERPADKPADRDDQPLDPAAERIRRKLVRFAIINIGILFVAVIAVLGAIVYKTMTYGDDEARAGPGEAAADARVVPDGGEEIEGTIALPQGARIASQSLSGTTMTLLVRLGDGSQAVFLYDIESDRMLGRVSVKEQRR